MTKRKARTDFREKLAMALFSITQFMWAVIACFLIKYLLLDMGWSLGTGLISAVLAGQAIFACVFGYMASADLWSKRG